ncbi:MAG TPA: hypothetical protein VGG42_18665 [Acidobacteriaceae bacterium]|jgi:hypothetical protein
MRLRVRPLLPVVVLPLFLLGPLLAGPQATSHGKRPAPTGPNGALPMPADRADDSYAIYSRLMPGEEFSRMAPELNAHWAIAEVTVNADDRNPAVAPQAQLKPPPENPTGFEEAVEDYQANKDFRIQLTKKPFHLNHDFSLLSPEQVDALRAAKSAPQVTSQAQARWAGYPGITFFSEVYFDAKHRSALVYMNDWCAQLCATGTWVYLEKQGGQWVRRSGVVVPGGY